MSSNSDKQKTLSRFLTKEYQHLVSFVKQYWQGDEEMDAGDIVQEVVLNLYNRIDFATPVENLLAYTYRSLKNRVIDRQRKKKNKMISEFDDAIYTDNHPFYEIPEDYHDDDEQNPEKDIIIMYALMDQLSADQREIIIKTEIEGYTFEALSEAWDIPIGTLLSRKHRGLGKLQKLMYDFKKLNK